MAYTVYISHSEKLNRYYTGFTSNIEIRLALHESPAAHKFTARANDGQLVFEILCGNKAQALAIEKHIKNMKSKTYIINLIKYPEMVERLKEKYSSVQESDNNLLNG